MHKVTPNAKLLAYGSKNSTKQALSTATKINKLFKNDLGKIDSLGRARFSCTQTLEYLKKLPQVSVTLLSQELNMTAPTARASLTHMVNLGILEEMSDKKRDKVYVYRKYLNILDDGAKPLKQT